MNIQLDLNSVESYSMFLKIKQLPIYKITGMVASFPDEYASRIGIDVARETPSEYTPIDGLFDYQKAIVEMAIEKGKFAVFADCGLGKTLIILEYARFVAEQLAAGKCVLIVSPLMVVKQTIAEAEKFYGDSLELEQVKAANLSEWLESGSGKIGITNYDSIREDLPRGRIGGLVLDESSTLKSFGGKWGNRLIDLGKGLEWKLCCTGTPAPNDRIEYANHAVLLDAFPTVNSFLARFFINRGQTQERWALKDHALEGFYRALSHWCIFLTNPATYGWTDLDTSTIPPIHIHQHHVELTKEQTDLACDTTGSLFAHKIGGIANRAALGGIAKGWHKGKDIPTKKPGFIRDLVDQWPEESTIIWCMFNKEQELLEKTFPEAASITGATPQDKREVMIDDFKSGRIKTLISKPAILGFGLNLQIATRQVFSGLADSYESFYQAVKRSNRIGSKHPLNVHIPITDIEEPMVANVLRKAKMVQKDTEEQERIFRESMS